jgi:ABC-type phosphate transport system substrate-binding protein
MARGCTQRYVLKKEQQHVKTSRSKWRGLAVLGTAGALSLSVLAGSASAAIPGGVACQSADGKISARGATFAKQLWDNLIVGYRDDICGAVADTAGAGLKNGTAVDPAGAANPTAASGMITYNYTTAGTGSGQGRTAMQCRTDAFGGSDGPYSNAQLAALNGAPLAAASCPPTVGTTVSPFLQAGFPNAADATAPMMSFPIGGASVVVAVNLTGAACPGGPAPGALQFTASMVDGIFDGRILTWSDPLLRAGGVNAGLANCTTPILRRVRSDDSGTTQIQKNYLAKVDPAGPGCDGLAGSDWTSLRNAAAPNNRWPNLPQVNPAAPSSAAATATCSAISSHNGNPGVAAAVNTTAGAVGYIDVADATSAAPNATQASVRNATDTDFVDPANGSTANCNFGPVAPPAGQNGAVGLNAADSWSNNNAGIIRSDVTNAGPGYPICGMTFAMVYTGLSGAPGGTAVSGLTANQRRTLYSFMSYALSNVAQDRLTSALYQRMPAGLVGTIRRGFQANF